MNVIYRVLLAILICPNLMGHGDLEDEWAMQRCKTHYLADQLTLAPAFKSIARRYAGNDLQVINGLVTKIIKGGNGNWGVESMPPHPHLSRQAVKPMVDWILRRGPDPLTVAQMHKNTCFSCHDATE